MESSASSAGRERRPYMLPLWFYLVMIFLFAAPAFGVGLRLLQGSSPLGPEDHESALIAYTPFALALLICLWLMRRNAARGTRAAAWVISAGIGLFFGRYLLPAIDGIPSAKDPIWDGFYWVVSFGVAMAMVLFAWRTAQVWRV